MSYVMVRGHWCGASVLNLLVPVEDINSDWKDSLFDALQQL
jgi:hypothetical protein